MDAVRLRVVFEQALCSELQKTEGLRRCWILLKPQHRTISDLSSHLLHLFHLHDACPNGLLLSMEGFVLPPFESTCILKDKDIIRVRKRSTASRELIEVDDDVRANALEVVEIVDKPPAATAGMNLLANEEFEKESGGYESEPEDDVERQAAKEEEEVLPEKVLEGRTSKKRKASKDLKSLKRKRNKSGSAGRCAVVSENGHAEESKALSATGADKRSKRSPKVKSSRKRLLHCMVREGECGKPLIPEHHTSGIGLFTAYKDFLNGSSNAIRSDQPQDDNNKSLDESNSPGTKKLPSRSARRKKAKRQWLREKVKAEREERHLVEKIDQQSTEKDNHAVSEKSPEEENHKISEQIPEKDSGDLKENHKHQDQDSDVEDDVVPVVIRPGHIRFQPLGKVSTDQAVQQNQTPVETFKWNGVTSKKKGQKWGTEKVASSKWNDYAHFNNDYANFDHDWSEMPAIRREKPICDRIDFDKLPLYATSPKEGDVIAYRLIELSSSWTPEPSSYRVGRISQYNSETNRVVLLPVPEHPLIPEKIEDEASGEPSEASPYGEDGSLEIGFSELLEVRIFNNQNQNSAEPGAVGVNEVHARDQDTGKSSELNGNNEAHALGQGNGERNVWEEINQALTSKKAELSQERNGSKTENSGWRPWSHKGLRGGALGPTMAWLRSQNEF